MSEKIYKRTYHEELIGESFKSRNMIFEVINGELTYVCNYQISSEYAHKLPENPKWGYVRNELKKLLQFDFKTCKELTKALSKESKGYSLMQEIVKAKIKELEEFL